MNPRRFGHWLRVSLLLALCSFTAYACGGARFTAAEGSGGAPSGVGGAGAGSGAGGQSEHKVKCQGPEDCDDGDPCTVDQCGTDGVCTTAPKCGVTERCCGGACGQCCDATDCDDGVKCTDDQCFAGGCTHSPDNDNCAAGEYCSATADCRHKETCSDSSTCDDSDPCTDDACSTGLCDHTATQCAGKTLCCKGVGCAECCEDSQCNDGDPCTTDSCAGNQCTHAPLCKDGSCCPGADKASATCGTCCSAGDCDDHVSCTKDLCTQGTCAHSDDGSCGVGAACDTTQMSCVKTAECSKDADCKPTNPCQTAACVSGQCALTTCGKGGKCCADGCKACCADGDCSDGVPCTKDTCNGGTCSSTPDNGACSAAAPICDPKLGCVGCTTSADCDDKNDCTSDVCDLDSHSCQNTKLCNAKCCCKDSDCQGGVTTQALPPIGILKCSRSVCNAGTCSTTTETCALLNKCCSYGCCSVQTQ